MKDGEGNIKSFQLTKHSPPTVLQILRLVPPEPTDFNSTRRIQIYNSGGEPASLRLPNYLNTRTMTVLHKQLTTPRMHILRGPDINSLINPQISDPKRRK